MLLLVLFPVKSYGAYILNETFTTGSRPANWWSGSGGNYAYATSPAPLEGTYSLLTESTQSLYQSGTENTGEQWGHFLFNAPSLPGSFSHILNIAYNFATKVQLTLNSSGTMTLGGCGAFETTSGAMSANTTYHVWWRYKNSTGGNNGQVEVWFNTTDDRDSTPSSQHQVYNSGTCTEGLGDHSFTSGSGYIMDVTQWANTDEFTGGGGGGVIETIYEWILMLFE